MSLDAPLARKKLDALWIDNNIPVLPTGRGKKYALFSDLHLGDKGGGDDFKDNEKAIQRALKDYHRRGFTLILLGDIEELWQFDLDKITPHYGHTVYADIAKFAPDRLFRIFGNHDGEWGFQSDPAQPNKQRPATAYEALKMSDQNGQSKILLVHGHQGCKESDKSSWFSRFAVRLFRGIEPLARSIGIYGNPSWTKSVIDPNYEKVLYNWAKKKHVLLICGHSHRAIFASLSYGDRINTRMTELQMQIRASRGNRQEVEKLLKEQQNLQRDWIEERENSRMIDPVVNRGKPKPCYFNAGCGLFREGITCIEIEEDEIRLAKWHRVPRAANNVSIYEKDSLTGLLARI